MKKYYILKLIFESPRGISPRELSVKAKTSITNIYVYLKELVKEELLRKDDGGKYLVNKTNENLGQVLDLQAMAPNKFHLLIAPQYKDILSKLCERTICNGMSFSKSEISKIERILIPLRIVLKTSKKPSRYCLKINENLTTSLLEYHDLNPNFSLIDFDGAIDRIEIRETEGKTKNAISEKEVEEMCNSAYRAEEDTTILKNCEKFELDSRLADLLRIADQINKEYRLFLNGLDEKLKRELVGQWEKKYIYNTNSIEGNTMSEKEVSEFLKKRIEPKGASKRELHETTNMRHALNFLKLAQNQDIDGGVVRNLHFLVQKDIGWDAGQYKKFYNYVKPNSPTTPPQHVKERMRMLVEWHEKNAERMHPFVLASIFHMQFELIHPFGDGNGRVGRLLMNMILQQNHFMPVTILEKTKQNYYRALENRSIHQFLLYTLTAFIEEYRR